MTDGMERTPLTRGSFDRSVREVAPGLLGRTLVRTTEDGPVEVRLTEVEVYAGDIGPGSHAFRGLTRCNHAMSGPPGHAYGYFTYSCRGSQRER
ncbi:hypothetical protein F0344_29420 [Streptomyces finlayi]|uniref:3-methyladenine DNA glycosylase n=1 Tax=Streptomyces finlayi TaxID=67296 RepID=A0A7G7BS61_9ACTN|nr:hypothetical protein F0344_29420 [Streptomyces finlayi]